MISWCAASSTRAHIPLALYVYYDRCTSSLVLMKMSTILARVDLVYR